MATTKQSIDKLNKYTDRLELLNKQLENVNKNTKEYKRLTKEKVNVEQKAIKVSKELSKAQGNLSSTLKNHKPLIENANNAQKRFNSTTVKSTTVTKGFFSKIKSAIGTLSRYALAYNLLNSVQRVFSELTIGSIKQSIEFEKALGNLGAVAGATSKEVELLGGNALSVAGKTKFTSQEIISLQTELSKLGFTSKEVVASTEAIAFTAQALNSPLDATAQQVGKIINQFGLLIEQSGFVGDVLVTTINNSALSMDSFGTAIQYVGPIAKNLGLSLEQTAGAMAVLADNGFTASRVGTGLRGIFTELGKTSADVEESLKSLAEQNISLSEAVELVGKRNASQLITLLSNIEAIDESTSKYYQQGKALESAAKQADTFAGRIELVTANFREFQKSIGDSIVNTELFLGVMDVFFPKAAETSRAFRTINDVGFQVFNKGAEEVAGGLDAMIVATELAGVSLEEYGEAFELLKGIEEGYRLESDVLFARQKALVTQVIGLIDALEKEAKEKKKNTAITLGQSEATDAYGESVKTLTNNFENGVNVNSEASDLFNDIGDAIKYDRQEINRLNGEIKINNSIIKTNKNLNEDEKDALENKNNELRVSVIQYKSSSKQMVGYQDQLTNVTISTEELANTLERINNDAVKAEAKRIKDQLKAINEETKNRVAALQEQAKIDTFASKSAEERGDIERNLLLDISKAYDKKAASIRAINVVEEENRHLVEDAIKLANKQAEILGSTVISDATKALKDYNSEFEKIKDEYLKGNIGLEEYRSSLKNTQDDYKKYIESLIDSGEVSDQVTQILLSLVDTYNEVSSSTDEVAKSTEKANKTIKEGKKDWDDFKKEFEDTGWADIASDAVDALGESLGAFNDVEFENTKNRLDADIDAIKNRYETEDDILKSQLNNQLITESQFRAKQKELRRAKVTEENAVAKELFNAQKKQDRNDAGLEGIEAAAQAYIEAFKNYEPATAIIVGSIGAGIAVAQSTAQISAINQRKYYDKKFADGGVVNGPSHSDGGVPFSVQGQGGYEMEGGEYIINKRSTSMYRGLLDQINTSVKPVNYSSPLKFANGGIVNSISNVTQQSNESVDYLKAIAEATVSTAIQTSKPVRAFISSSDLRTNETERRLRDRNDRI